MVKFSLYVETSETEGPMNSLSSARLSLFKSASSTFFIRVVD